MTDKLQEDFKIEMVGTVTAPPDLSAILEKIGNAASSKQEITLSPGEARVLSDYIVNELAGGEPI